MDMLNNLDLPKSFNSDSVDIFEEIEAPLLSASNLYKKSVGYFDPYVLFDYKHLLIDFIDRNGKIQVLFGDPIVVPNALSADVSEKDALIRDELLRFFSNPKETVKTDLIALMMREANLEMKFVLRASGIHHEKVRIASDGVNFVATVGSDNWTRPAMSRLRNREAGSLYVSWKSEIFDDYGKPLLTEFDMLWNDKSEHSVTIGVDSETYEQILARIKGKSAEQIMTAYRDLFNSLIATKKRELRSYQSEAIVNWQKNKFQGVWALCTGAGKTFTAITAVKRLINHKKTKSPFFIVIAVPFKPLGEQWSRELAEEGVQVFRAWSDDSTWKSQISTELLATGLKAGVEYRYLCIVTVNDTFFGYDFQSQVLDKVRPDQLLIIADEVHRHGNKALTKTLPAATFRLGLSATPYSENELEQRKNITDYYGQIVAEYDLGQAIKDKNLCPYDYFLYSVDLTQIETERFEELCGKIENIDLKINKTQEDQKELKNLYRTRSKILSMAESKRDVVLTIINSIEDKQGVLVYTGEGSVVGSNGVEMSQIEFYSKMLYENGWDVSKITAEVSDARTRRLIINSFTDGVFNALVSIKILDEGFDVPGCKHAILLANSTNERQFIQRRGRVLRTHPSKEFACIYDFRLNPSYSSDLLEKYLVSQEDRRVKEFSKYARRVQKFV